MTLPKCPQCNEDYTYQDGHLLICPMCSYEWTEESQKLLEEEQKVKDVNGNVIEDGDTVTIAKDIKLGKETIKQGTKAKGIKILDEIIDGHDIQGKVDGFGVLLLKGSVVKK